MAKKVNNILITGLSKEESEALEFAMNETGMATATGTIRKLLLSYRRLTEQYRELTDQNIRLIQENRRVRQGLHQAYSLLDGLSSSLMEQKTTDKTDKYET